MEKVETLSSIVQQLREQIVSNNSETGWDLKGNVLRLLSTVSIDKSELTIT